MCTVIGSDLILGVGFLGGWLEFGGGEDGGSGICEAPEKVASLW